jgi:uncharacterized protein YgiM (DUF1202 family)
VLPFKPGNTFFNLVPLWIDGYQLTLLLTDAPSATVRGSVGVNMHTGPGEAYRYLDVAYPGDTFRALGRNRSGDWLQVQREGEDVVWMPLAELDLTDVQAMALPIVRPGNER